MKFFLFTIGFWGIIKRSETVDEEAAVKEFGQAFIDRVKVDGLSHRYTHCINKEYIFTSVSVNN